MTNLIVTVDNYSGGSLNNQLYSTGGDWACNYPVYQGWTGNTVDASIGDTILTASGGLLDLLTDSSTNVPTYKWIVCETGEVFELDYIINDTTAKLKTASGYNTAGGTAFVVDFMAQPVVADSALMDTGSGGFGVPGVPVSLVTGTSAIDVSANFDVRLGNCPFLMNMTASSGVVAINIMFESYNT